MVNIVYKSTTIIVVFSTEYNTKYMSGTIKNTRIQYIASKYL